MRSEEKRTYFAFGGADHRGGLSGVQHELLVFGQYGNRKFGRADRRWTGHRAGDSAPGYDGAWSLVQSFCIADVFQAVCTDGGDPVYRSPGPVPDVFYVCHSADDPLLCCLCKNGKKERFLRAECTKLSSETSYYLEETN